MTVTAKDAWSATRAGPWAASLAAIGFAVLLRGLADPLLGDTVPFVTLFGAVTAAVWICGARAAAVAALVGWLACSYFFVEPRGQIAFDRSDVVVGLVAYAFTCGIIIWLGTTMRGAQARASEQREILRVTLGSIGDGVVTTGVNSRVTYLNAVAEQLTGWTHDEAYGQRLDDVFRIVNEATRASVENPAIRALREGVVVGLANHTVLIRQDGGELPIDDSAAPIRDEKGRVSGCVLIFRDVSERRRAERERMARLRDARTLAAIVESSEVAILSKSLDGTITSWNAAAERLFGHPASFAIGKHISIVIPPERIAEEDEIIAKLRAGRRVEHLETERVRADGRRVLVSLSISPIKDDDGNVIGASKIIRDVTREREAETERSKFVTLVETSTDFIGICDLDGVLTFVNRAGLEMVGLDSVEHARATPLREFFFPEDQARVMDELLPTVLRDGNAETEIRFRHFKNGAARWMAYKVLALVDESGKPTAFATVSQDVTERRRLEDNLRALAADLSASDRRKDEFLATLSHELRSPLAPLANVLEIWKRSTDRETLERARDAMERQLGQLVRLVDDLLDLNRITHDRFELRRAPVELGAALSQAVEACRPLAESLGHELEVELPSEPVWLNADAVRLGQVFGNLLNNACKYTDAGGTISVSARRSGDVATITVKDTGTGIPADKLESIFEMFTQVDRSSERGQGGLGIGLTLVKRLVEMHGGSVEARSNGAGRGSEFVVRLPAMAKGVGEPIERDAAPASIERKRRILVVDDNTDAARSLAMLLELAGHETYTAHDGVAAVEAADERRPDVVLLDIGLPYMSGHDVCRRIRSRDWGKQAVLIAVTGWGQDEDRRKSDEAGFDGHLVKPVDYDVLTELLAAMDR